MERKETSAELGVIQVGNSECRVRNGSEGDGWDGDDEDGSINPPSPFPSPPGEGNKRRRRSRNGGKMIMIRGTLI
jgi:hypothetical protein